MMFTFWRRKWPTVQLEQIRHRARLLVIDDQEFPYQRLFSRDGYTIEQWKEVERLSDLEGGKFDLLLLDLHGVGVHESPEHGFAILKHLRDHAPAQMILAYSNADWSLKYQDFFQLADAVLPKTADYFAFKERVDGLLQERFSLGFYVSRVLREVEGIDVDRSEIELVTQRAILKRDVRRLNTRLAAVVTDPRILDRILSIANSAIGIMTLWTR